MKEKVRFLGLDVHADTIAVAVAEPDGSVRSLGTIANRAESIRKLVKKLGPAEQLKACYEAGPTGYVLYWQLAELGVKCDVIAPTLVPVKAGDRVKTDRRDAEKLAHCLRAGDLTAARFPARTPAASEPSAGASPKPAMRICGESLSKPPGAIGCDRASDRRCACDKKAYRKSSRRSPGRRRIDCTSATPGWRRPARISARSSPRWDANCWASSGLSESRRRPQSSSAKRPEEEQEQRQKQKLSKE